MADHRDPALALVRVVYGCAASQSLDVELRLLRGVGLAQLQLQFAEPDDQGRLEIHLPNLSFDDLALMVDFERVKQAHLADGNSLKSVELPLSKDVTQLEQLLDPFVRDWVCNLSWRTLCRLMRVANTMRCQELVTCLGCRLAVWLNTRSSSEIAEEMHLGEDHCYPPREWAALEKGIRWAYDEKLSR